MVPIGGSATRPPASRRSSLSSYPKSNCRALRTAWRRGSIGDEEKAVLRITCPACRARLRSPDTTGGRSAVCGACGAPLEIAGKLKRGDCDLFPDVWQLDPEGLPEDWRIVWEERAAILEHDGGLPREKAEALAMVEVEEQRRSREGADRADGDASCGT